MDYHLKGNYSESIKIYENLIKINNFNNLNEKSNLFCNLALAEYGLGLFRKSLKSCEQAILYDEFCLRAYEIETRIYIAMKKIDKAKECAANGLQKVNNFSDFSIANQLYEILLHGNTLSNITNSTQQSTNEKGKNSLPTTISSTASIIPTIPSSSPQQIQTQPQSQSQLQPQTQTQTQRKKQPFQHLQQLPQKHQQSIATLTELKEIANSKDSTKLLPDLNNLKEDFPTKELLTLEQLTQIRDYFISNGTQEESDNLGKINSSYIAAARQNLSYATGIEVLDDLIAFGYLVVNSNKLREAYDLFQLLLTYKPDLYAGHLAIGSILALEGKYDESIKAFTVALSISPYEPDGWKRRGQTRAAAGNVLVALEDFNHALSLGNDPDTYYQRGLLYQQMRNFRLALADFLKHGELTKSNNNPLLFNHIGLCQSQLGDIEIAITSFKKSTEIDENFIDGYLNYAQMHKELGKWKETEIIYDQIIQKFQSSASTSINIEKTLAQLYYFRAGHLYSLGKSLSALGYSKRYFHLICNEFGELKSMYNEKDLINVLLQMGLCFTSLGLYKDAIECYNQVLIKDPINVCRIQKRILLYYYTRLNINPGYFNIDRDMSGLWKEIWSKSLSASIHLIPDSPVEKTIEDLYSIESINNNEMKLTPEQEKIKQIANIIGPWIHLDSRGFIPNLRLKRCFGYATLQMAQSLLRNIEHLHEIGSPITVSNCGSSQKILYSDDDGEHLFGYRDFFDIAVKWRQLAEPNDSVWWIDGFTRESFIDGFGLQTPIISGQLKCIRYYKYYEMGFQVLKTQAALKYYTSTSQCIIPSLEKHKLILQAKDLDDIHNIIGKDFYIVCPCESLNNPQSTILEGTRLTVLKRHPDGYEFSIRSPCLPIRWVAMDQEMKSCFENIIQALIHQKYSSQVADTELFTSTLSSALSSSSLSSPLNTNNSSKISSSSSNSSNSSSSSTTTTTINPVIHALKLFYYWTNFSPLSRGSAFCGYCGLMAIILAFGYRFSSPIPSGRQLDWEAIFTSNPNTFISNILPHLTTEIFEWNEVFKGININDSFLTLKDMIKLLYDGIDEEEN